MEQNKRGIRNKLNFGYFIALISFLASLFFLSPNLTGEVIGSMQRPNSNLLSLVLFVFGITTFLIMKDR